MLWEADDLSHSQLQVLFLLIVYSFSISGYKECNRFDFGIDHLVMSMWKVVSCVVKKEYLLWLVHSPGRIQSFCPASFCSPRPDLPVMNRTSYFDVSSGRSSRSSVSWSTSLSSASVDNRSIDLDYCDIEWFALETNRDHSVIFEVAPNYCISDSFVDY